MRELPLNALRAFAAIHATGGVRAAARELRIAHSSVSRHLAELEACAPRPWVRASRSPAIGSRATISPPARWCARSPASM